MSAPKYDMRTNPVYQVDFTKNSKGKTLARTKRRVTFGFGFSNAEALAKGLTGIHCRGEEHEVTVVWSLTSGKRTVMADGQEVHFSQGKRTELQFECSWTMKGNHVVRLVANAIPSSLREPGARSFELFLDGLSYFAMPKIYELGIVSGQELLSRNGRKGQANVAPAPMHMAPAQSYGNRGGNGYYREEEPPQWTGPGYVAHNNYRAQSTLDVPSAPPAQPEPRRAESMPTIDLISAPTPGQDYLTAAPALIDYSPQPQYSNQSVASDEFAPVVSSPTTYNDLSSQILSAYGSTTPSLHVLANESHTYAAPAAQPYTPQSYASTGTSSPSAYFSEPAEYDYAQCESQDSPTSIRQLTDLEKAMQNLVNFDDISEPAVGPLKLTMAKEEEKLKARNKGKSTGLAPVAPAWQLGAQASLADIQAHAAPRAAPAKDVMRTNVFDPAAGQAGMLVVYGQTPNEAPPIQQGFGYYAYGRAFSAH